MPRTRNRIVSMALATTLVVTLALPLPVATAGVEAQGGSEVPDGPFNLELLAEIGETTHRAVEASGGVMYVISGDRLETRANTSTADLLAATGIRGLDVYPYGNGVMVLRPGGFAWVDCADPASPAVLGEFHYSDDVTMTGFFASGGYAYFSYEYVWGGGGTKVVDLSDPADLHYVAYSGLIFGDLHGDVRNGYAYVATAKGFKTLSLASPTAPAVVREYASAAAAGDLALEGSHLYLAHGDPADYAKAKGLRVFNLASPANPALVAERVTSAPLMDVSVSGTRAWYVDSDNRAGLYNVAAPSAPATEAGTVPTASTPERIAAAGSFAHVLTRDDSGPGTALLTIDGRVPDAATLANDERRLGGYAGTFASDTHLFATNSRGFEVFSLADPAAPAPVATYDSGGHLGAKDIRTVGAVAYVATGDSLVTVSDALTAPALASTWTSAGASVDRLERVDGHLFAASSRGLLIFDIVSAAPAPVLLSAYRTVTSGMEAGLAGQPYLPPTGPVTDVAVAPSADGRAWVVVDATQDGYSNVIELDCANPAAPVRLAEYVVSGDDPTVEYRASGGRKILYVGLQGEWSSRVKVFDVTGRGKLVCQSAFKTGVGGSYDVASSAGVTDTVFVVGESGLRAANSQVLAAPYLSGYHALGGDRVGAVRDLVVTSDADDAVRIFRYTGETQRKFGMTRYDTAVALSRDFASSEYVIIATGRSFPDALAAAPLAYALDAPILLVNEDSIPESVNKEIVRLGATKAIVVGGKKAVTESVVDALVALGIPRGAIGRISGTDRYETSKAVALKLKEVLGGGDLPLAFCASGANFPDALAAGGAAAKLGAPILLVEPGKLPYATYQALKDLKVTDTVIVGGKSAVGEWADTKLPSPERLAGWSRYDTAKEIADWSLDPANGAGFTASEVFIVTGRNFPDALGCGVVSARHDGVTLLVSASVPAATKSFVVGKAGGIDAVHVVGGPGAVPPEIEWQIAKLMR